MSGFLRRCPLLLAGSAILAFGLYHVHAFSGVTEGGILGLTLFLHHFLRISPAASGFVLNLACFLFAIRMLGRDFALCSVIAGGGFSLFYAVFEQFDPLFPMLRQHTLIAAVAGAAFVGVGVGLCVRAGGAPTGDDALAMALSTLLRRPIERIYLISDLSVLALSALYLPPANLLCSLLTVILSGQIIGLIQRFAQKTNKERILH